MEPFRSLLLCPASLLYRLGGGWAIHRSRVSARRKLWPSHSHVQRWYRSRFSSGPHIRLLRHDVDPHPSSLPDNTPDDPLQTQPRQSFLALLDPGNLVHVFQTDLAHRALVSRFPRLQRSTDFAFALFHPGCNEEESRCGRCP